MSKLTNEEIRENADEFISRSDNYPLNHIDRASLAEQMQYTIADGEDIETIASLIEKTYVARVRGIK